MHRPDFLPIPIWIGSILPKKNEYDFFRLGNGSNKTPKVSIDLPEFAFTFKWFNLSTGTWSDADQIKGGKTTLKAPGGGDWILLLTKEN